MPQVKCDPGKWIPCALKNHEKGALHRMLHVPKKERIPDFLLKTIMSKKAGAGEAIMYNGHIISITKLLKQRVNLALTLRGR
jgi:hypothetical protein